MTRNQLFEWCIACGFTAEHVNEYERAFEALVETVQYFERVKEREACAKVCEDYAKANEESDIMVEAFLHCADRLRNRGNV